MSVTLLAGSLLLLDVTPHSSDHDIKDQFRAKVAASLSNSSVSVDSTTTPPTLPNGTVEVKVTPTDTSSREVVATSKVRKVHSIYALNDIYKRHYHVRPHCN